MVPRSVRPGKRTRAWSRTNRPRGGYHLHMTTVSPTGRAVRILLFCLALTLAACAAAPATSEQPIPSQSGPFRSADATAAATPDPTASPSPATGVRADLERLLSVLDRVHPEPFHGVSREEFVAALDAYEAELPKLSPEESVVELMRVWAMLSREGRDGHQFALPQVQHEGPVLPIRVYEFAEGVFVTAAAPGTEPTLVGSRITAIGEVAIDDVLAAIEPLVPRDGPATVPAFRPIFLVRLDVLRGLGLVEDGSVPLSVVRPDGTSMTVDLQPLAADADASWAGPVGMHQLPLDARLRYLASGETFSATLDGRTAYVRYRSVQSVDVREVRQWLDRDEADRLVLDLRQNPGGDNGTYGRLLRLVVDFAEAHPGGVTVLIDRVTFSAASNLATEIEQTTDARFVGEPMAGGLNFWNDVTWVDLVSLPIPMRAAVSERYWQFASPDDERLTIEPDVPIEITAADHFAGRDPALEAALNP